MANFYSGLRIRLSRWLRAGMYQFFWKYIWILSHRLCCYLYFWYLTMIDLNNFLWFLINWDLNHARHFAKRAFLIGDHLTTWHLMRNCFWNFDWMNNLNHFRSFLAVPNCDSNFFGISILFVHAFESDSTPKFDFGRKFRFSKKTIEITFLNFCSSVCFLRSNEAIFSLIFCFCFS